jgi:HAD superfamily hydrolase (TIGR01490 family)
VDKQDLASTRLGWVMVTALGYRCRMPSAAFFDLDKTILARSSSFAFARPLYRNGLIGRVDVVRSAYAQFVYMASGADHDQMERMRAYMAELVAGWDVQTVQGIVAETLDDVVEPMIYQEALDLIELHKAAGRTVIIISTSGTDLVEPIGARLGADITIGTQVAVEDGCYTGEILFYAYGPGKAEAMLALAAEHDFDLDDCYAYTDSQTDLPMLELVGHPVAVNPDAELRRIALERQWPIRDFAKPVGMRRHLAPRQAAAAGAGVAIGAVALGVAWYAMRRAARA